MVDIILNLLKKTDPDKELRKSGKLPQLKKFATGGKAVTLGEEGPSFLQKYIRALPVDDLGRSSIYRATRNYKKGGIIGKGQGKVMRHKTTKNY
jgi:hypothetical protein